MSTATERKRLTFRLVDGRGFTGEVKNPSATLGQVARRFAARAGLAGSFEMVNDKGVTLDPDMTLADLPDGEVITMPSELTPAA